MSGRDICALGSGRVERPKEDRSEIDGGLLLALVARGVYWRDMNHRLLFEVLSASDRLEEAERRQEGDCSVSLDEKSISFQYPDDLAVRSDPPEESASEVDDSLGLAAISPLAMDAPVMPN